MNLTLTFFIFHASVTPFKFNTTLFNNYVTYQPEINILWYVKTLFYKLQRSKLALVMVKKKIMVSVSCTTKSRNFTM